MALDKKKKPSAPEKMTPFIERHPTFEIYLEHLIERSELILKEPQGCGENMLDYHQFRLKECTALLNTYRRFYAKES